MGQTRIFTPHHMLAKKFAAPLVPQMWSGASKQFGHFEGGGGEVGVKGCSLATPWTHVSFSGQILLYNRNMALTMVAASSTKLSP